MSGGDMSEKVVTVIVYQSSYRYYLVAMSGWVSEGLPFTKRHRSKRPPIFYRDGRGERESPEHPRPGDGSFPSMIDLVVAWEASFA
jgi:hypothetical protein